MNKNTFVFFLLLIACTKQLSMPPETSQPPPDGQTSSNDSNPEAAPTGDVETASPLLDPSPDSNSSDPQSAQVGASISPPDEPVYLGVHITEVVTDPQRDWNDTVGGNGILFDSIPGHGTIGSTDEWIEIENDSPDVMDISGYALAMVDGTNETEFFGAPKGTYLFSDAGTLQDFGADEFLVIGNPPGDLKNAVTITLTDASGGLLDEVTVENGDAQNISNESFQLTSTGDWMMGEASIGK